MLLKTLRYLPLRKPFHLIIDHYLTALNYSWLIFVHTQTQTAEKNGKVAKSSAICVNDLIENAKRISTGAVKGEIYIHNKEDDNNWVT